MKQPRSAYLNAAGHELHVTEWGDPASPPLVMWHGLARTGRDFDEAAEALSDSYFVLCPDMLGRGLSAWLPPGAGAYDMPTYAATAVALLDQYRIEHTRWVGTSMGGLIGMMLAGGALRDRITHLLINDVGPELPKAGAQRIADYVGNPPIFDTIGELETWLRNNYVPFGLNSPAFWRRMADTSARRTDAGRITVHYDPAIATLLGQEAGPIDIWPAYEAIAAKTLLMRGEHSDVLPAEIAEAMQRRGPQPGLATIGGCGHAPTLADAAQIAILRDFLLL
ncbi:alpha/beta fold hydrolase [Devosia sp. A449]